MSQQSFLLRQQKSGGVLPIQPVPRAPRNFEDRDPAAPRLLSLAAYDRRDQFDVWRTRLSAFWDTVPLSNDHAATGFTAEYVSANLGGVILNSGRFSAHALERIARPASRSPLDHWSLVLGRSGEAWLDAGGRELRAGPGDMFLVSLDQEHRGQLSDYEGLAMFLPRDALSDVAPALDSASATALSGPLAGLLADYLTDLEKRIIGMSEEELLTAGRAAAAMVATCVQPSRDRLDAARPAIEAALFERGRAYIQAHLSNPDLGADLLLQELGVSRASLDRAFEHEGGVAHYIQRRRLHAARAALAANPNRLMQDIASSVGYRHAADFARAFRREFGFSPSEARERGGP
ncbi:MAG TPA: helix-turn-helix domain-containing protein [Roseiarcus sp.]|nr:helix-turn-helix domain-containing protein [Roseiarcus sp.]